MNTIVHNCRMIGLFWRLGGGWDNRWQLQWDRRAREGTREQATHTHAHPDTTTHTTTPSCLFTEHSIRSGVLLLRETLTPQRKQTPKCLSTQAAAGCCSCCDNSHCWRPVTSLEAAWHWHQTRPRSTAAAAAAVFRHNHNTVAAVQQPSNNSNSNHQQHHHHNSNNKQQHQRHRSSSETSSGAQSSSRQCVPTCLRRRGAMGGALGGKPS